MTVIDPESMLELGDEPSESLDGQLRPQPVEQDLVPDPVLRGEADTLLSISNFPVGVQPLEHFPRGYPGYG